MPVPDPQDDRRDDRRDDAEAAARQDPDAPAIGVLDDEIPAPPEPSEPA